MPDWPPEPPDLDEPPLLLLLPLEVDEVDEAGDGDASLRPGDADADGLVDTVTGEVREAGGLAAAAALAGPLLLRSCGDVTAGGMPDMFSYLHEAPAAAAAGP